MNTKRFLTTYGPMFGIWILIVLLFGVLSDNFLTTRTFLTIAGQVPPLVIICCGMTLILIIGGIDLSVGSVLALSASLLCVALARWELALPVAAFLAIFAGFLMGAFNGAISVLLKIPSFVVTLGTLKIAFGLAMLVTASETVPVGTTLEPLAQRISGIGLPVSFLVAIVFVILFQVILSKTVYGRYLVAIGTNEKAVQLAGIPTNLRKISVYAITGALVGVASIFFAARLGAANADAGNGLELSAIAAVVIGGTSLTGGRGSVVNSFVGAMIILTLDSGLAQIGAAEFAKHMVTGIVIVVAVLLDALRGDFLQTLKNRFRKTA